MGGLRLRSAVEAAEIGFIGTPACGLICEGSMSLNVSGFLPVRRVGIAPDAEVIILRQAGQECGRVGAKRINASTSSPGSLKTDIA